MIDVKVVAGQIILRIGGTSKVLSLRDVRYLVEGLVNIPEARKEVLKVVARKRLEEEGMSREFLEMVLRQVLRDHKGNDMLVRLLHEYGFSYVEVPVETVIGGVDVGRDKEVG